MEARHRFEAICAVTTFNVLFSFPLLLYLLGCAISLPRLSPSVQSRVVVSMPSPSPRVGGSWWLLLGGSTSLDGGGVTREPRTGWLS